MIGDFKTEKEPEDLYIELRVSRDESILYAQFIKRYDGVSFDLSYNSGKLIFKPVEVSDPNSKKVGK